MTMTEDHTFCRLLLKETMKDVRRFVSVAERKKAWAYKYDFGQTAEFHGPNGFYWHGSAHCLWHARANGWSAYLNKYHPEINS
jgi:hypothetical protein